MEKMHLLSIAEIHEMTQFSTSHTTAQLQTISQVSQDRISAVLQGHTTPPFEIKVTDVKVFCHSNKSQWLSLIMFHLSFTYLCILKLQGGKNFLVLRDPEPLLVEGERIMRKNWMATHVSLNAENLSMLA